MILGKKMMIFFIIGTVVFFLEAACWAGGIVASWDPNTESRLAKYNVYICSTYELAVRGNADIAFFSVPDVANPSFCLSIDNVYQVVFIGVAAVDDNNEESERAVAYLLFGNIYGDFNEGVSYRNARVDGLDLSTLGFYFGQTTSHQQIDCSGYFVVEIQTLKQKSDLDGSNRIDGFDLIELGLRFGNYAN